MCDVFCQSAADDFDCAELDVDGRDPLRSFWRRYCHPQAPLWIERRRIHPENTSSRLLFFSTSRSS
jgi:hypothetical protein